MVVSVLVGTMQRGTRWFEADMEEVGDVVEEKVWAHGGEVLTVFYV